MKWSHVMAGLAVSMSIILSTDHVHAAAGFQTTATGTVYTTKDGTVLTGWQVIDGKTYYFATDGTMAVGWQAIDGATYYFETDGVLVTGRYEIDGATYLFADDGKQLKGWQQLTDGLYYFKSNGVMATGFLTVDGKRYLFSLEGKRLNGWQTVNGVKHYVFDNGTIRTGMYTINGKKYLLLKDGRVATGWQQVGTRHYYFGTTGVRQHGLKKIGTTVYGFHETYGYRLAGVQKVAARYYYFGTDGKRRYGLQTIEGKVYGFHPVYGYRLQGKHKVGSHYYYFHSTGVRETGWKYTTQYEYYAPTLTKKTDWQVINSKWYFFDSSGVMYKNKRIGNAAFDARGVYSNPLSSYKMSVPLYRQFQMGYPSGCEFFSLKMALEKKGRVVSAETLYREMPKSMWNARYENRLYRWVDPNVMFTGDPKGKLSKYRNYGIYPKGMINFSSKYRPVKDLSGQGLASIERELSLGNPVIVWASVDFKQPYGHFNWYTASNQKFTGFVNYHVMLATGYDKNNLYINDPYRGRLVIPKSQVSSVMGATGWKALAVR
ncbi:C39 family peptidase [Exiguobacterium sp. s146]|uniref:C39 family peptidase n=1 Tax=Exiguobacterium sp. s146 TaxID=2751223 RepID=UPI001BE69588|nr:C39 family peptidase [Exiguobacterium sp. s146]